MARRTASSDQRGVAPLAHLRDERIRQRLDGALPMLTSLSAYVARAGDDVFDWWCRRYITMHGVDAWVDMLAALHESGIDARRGTSIPRDSLMR